MLAGDVAIVGSALSALDGKQELFEMYMPHFQPENIDAGR